MKSFYKIITVFIITLLANSAYAFDTIARSAMVVDQTTGTILMAKDAYRMVPPASMSKLMTLYMLFEALRDERIAMDTEFLVCLLYTSPSPRDRTRSRMPSSA